MKYLFKLIFSLISFLFITNLDAQNFDKSSIQELVLKYKLDSKGPYKDIRWFCKDGSIRDPKDPCPKEIGPGVQHARYKEAIVSLGKKNHIYLGQILSYTVKKDFWDIENNHSRLKQYQLEKYLRTVDNGWILQKAQYYRGAIQIEDEEAWGVDFYKWLLTDDENISKNFFLIRQSLKDIPHKGDNNVAQLMRSQSKVISDELASFMKLRIKIHGQPEITDIDKVISFRNKTTLTAGMKTKIDELLVTMDKFYTPFSFKVLEEKSIKFKNTPIGHLLANYIKDQQSNTLPNEIISNTSNLLIELRREILTEKSAIKRLEILDISIALEDLIFKTSPNWQPKTLDELLNKIYYLGMANAGAGNIELWEWNKIEGILRPTTTSSNTLDELMTKLETARSEVEWSSAMVKVNYNEVVNNYNAFEPKAYGFIDDRIRSSIILHLGKSVSDLGDFITKESTLTNKVLNIPNQSSIRGLNPGYAFGELVVVGGSSDDIEVNSNKIYIFERPPSDLKPIAGIATVSEGNLVSHVQLLARNLGIPNAALSDNNLLSLKDFDGKKVFYAVSNKGNVIIKLEKDMLPEELLLFSKKTRSEDKIEVPIEKIKLDQTNILNLRSVDASESGKLCGPKAANLGQLKKMFPENVVEGLVIPFGIFKEHMNQEMPGENISYWKFLNNMFETAQEMQNQKIEEVEIENYQLSQLEILRKAIKVMPLKSEFVDNLEKQFQSIFGSTIGNVPVFLRSDTNMEDLKDFTGAGLNLTLFNVLTKEKIINGIKDVWASPYTERSFKWRQKYLLNPENVFPSILVIPSVDVDYSGVLITKGISNGDNNDLTVAFSRGAGGAVDGQSAETYLLKKVGDNRLLAPSREVYANTLPIIGGTEKRSSTFETPILKQQNIDEINQLAETIRKTMVNENTSNYQGAYDVELGFKDDKLWLFQIRPFVENKRALGSEYLESITPKFDINKKINLTNPL